MNTSENSGNNGVGNRIDTIAKIVSNIMSGGSLIDEDSISRLDHEFKAALSRAFSGMSPIEIALAYLDWLSHLAISPGKQLRLVQSLIKKSVHLGLYSVAALIGRSIAGPASKLERRVSSERWQRWPFNFMAQVHQTSKDWWQEAGSDVAGVTNSHQELVKFITGQVLDLVSPANFLLTNPDVHKETIEKRGRNLARGAKHFAQDTYSRLSHQSPSISDDFQA